MTNANRIRQMTDEELNAFLWRWKIKSVVSFMQHGGLEIMGAHQQLKWLQEEEGKSAPVEVSPWDGGEGVFVTSLAVAAGSADEKMDFLENKEGRARNESNDQSPTE